MLGFMPARPDTEVQSAAADVIDGDGHLGEHCRIAIGTPVTMQPIRACRITTAIAAKVVQPSCVGIVFSTNP